MWFNYFYLPSYLGEGLEWWHTYFINEFPLMWCEKCDKSHFDLGATTTSLFMFNQWATLLKLRLQWLSHTHSLSLDPPLRIHVKAAHYNCILLPSQCWHPVFAPASLIFPWLVDAVVMQHSNIIHLTPDLIALTNLKWCMTELLQNEIKKMCQWLQNYNNYTFLGKFCILLVLKLSLLSDNYFLRE